MGCRLGSFPFIYLGLPLSNKKLTKQAYIPLIQKFNKRLAGWAAKYLSIAGRLVLINAVLSSLPVYFMSCLNIPAWVIKEIDKIRRRFLWHGVTQETKKLSLANWEVVCTPKIMGGLGVTDLRIFNQSLLTKHYWQWVRPTTNLWKPLISQMGTDHTALPTANLFTSTLKEVIGFARASIMRKPGNGNTISFWHEDWGLGILKHTLPTLYTYCRDDTLTLANVWHEPELLSLFMGTIPEEEETHLQQLNSQLRDITLNSGISDEAHWKWTSQAQFSVKSAYFTLMNRPRIGTHITRVWKLEAPPRFKVFGWLAMRNRILTIDNLKKKGMCIVNRCVMCRQHEETVKHLFHHCTTAKILHIMVAGHFNVTGLTLQDITDKAHTKRHRSIALITCFIIWRERCGRTFKGNDCTLNELLTQIVDQCHGSFRQQRG